jgi:hypothetical protein
VASGKYPRKGTCEEKNYGSSVGYWVVNNLKLWFTADKRKLSGKSIRILFQKITEKWPPKTGIFREISLPEMPNIED